MALELEGEKLEKVCIKCETPKILSDFPVDSRNADGRMGSCKVCENERSKAWQLDHPERVLDFRRAKDNVALLQSAASYLDRWRGRLT